jgi:hypothetical protein
VCKCKSAKKSLSNTESLWARALKNFGAPLATNFAYKMKTGGKGMWGPGPTCTNIIYKKIFIPFWKKLAMASSVKKNLSENVLT